MNLIYPRIAVRLLPRMLAIAALGGLLGGIYGALHDQISYAISPEYFTRMKFDQFRYLDFGLPSRVFASEVGAMATWWVGFFGAWFLARAAVPAWPGPMAWRRCLIGFAIVALTAIAAGAAGLWYGLRPTPDPSGWQTLCRDLGVRDVRGFVRVAYLHNASYLGGLVGIGIALALLHRWKRRSTTGNPR